MDAADAAGTADGEPPLDTYLETFQREYPEVDPQVETIVAALFKLQRRMSVAYGRRFHELGITSAEWEVLKTLVLSGSPYRLGPGELARSLGLTPAAMTHRIDRMVTEGLVTRTRDEANRVRVIIGLTETGRERWMSFVREASAFEEGLLQDLDAPRRAWLAEALVGMLDRVESGEAPSAAVQE